MPIFPQVVVLKAIFHTHPKSSPIPKLTKYPSILQKVGSRATGLTYIPSPIKLQTQLSKKFQSPTQNQ
jgi:hypothetical protein